MPLSQYSELVTSISAWTARSDLTIINDFIAMAEAEFNRRLRVDDMLTPATLTISSSSAQVTLPTDFLKLETIALTTDPPKLDFVSMKQLVDIYGVTKTSRPKAVALKNKTTLQFGPAPDATYSAELSYYAKIPGLSTSNTTNWLLTKEPEAYLFVSLHKALSYIVDSERKMEIENNYNRIIAELTEENDDSKAGGAGMAVRTDTGNP